MSRASYVAITGIRHPIDARNVVQLVGPSRRLFCITALLDAQEIEQNIYDSVKEAGRLFPNSEGVLPILRYSTIGKRAGFAPYLSQALKIASSQWLTAIEIDVPWPDPASLVVFKRMHGQSVILRVGPDAYREAWGTYDQIVKRLGEYKDVVTDIMFDVCGLFPPTNLLTLLRFVRVQMPQDINLGIAGTFTVESLIKDLLSLLVEFPNLSIETTFDSLQRDPKTVAQFVADLDRLTSSLTARAATGA
ncbi:hypothetical protein HY631_04270 [Candidatus Uhrbacteria bacterium]|nr:hypothetical protein [Candidatus Uhrbacteria bacterium]